MDSTKIKKFLLLGIPLLSFLLGVFFYILITLKPALLESILVIGNSTSYADALVVMAGNRSERIPATVELYRKGYASRILLTNDGILGGWSPKYQRNLYLVEWAKEYLLTEGIPEDAIEILDFSESGSYFDALNTKNYVLAEGDLQSLLVVTSDYHTRRTLWVFKHVFSGSTIKISVYPSPGEENKGKRLKVLSTELIKLLYYRLRYGLLSS